MLSQLAWINLWDWIFGRKIDQNLSFPKKSKHYEKSFKTINHTKILKIMNRKCNKFFSKSQFTSNQHVKNPMIKLSKLCKKVYIDSTWRGGVRRSTNFEIESKQKLIEAAASKVPPPISIELRRAPTSITEVSQGLRSCAKLRRAPLCFTELRRGSMRSSELCRIFPSSTDFKRVSEIRQALQSSANVFRALTSYAEFDFFKCFH